MHLRDSGIFDVAPSEQITFTVTRKDPQNKAAFAPSHFVGGTTSEPDVQTKKWSGAAPATNNSQCDMTITFDFTGDTAGTFDEDDKYFVEIQGKTGPTINDSVNAGPILRTRFYSFEVTTP